VSTTWFAKIDCNFHSNRKAMKAGRLGREVFVFVLCINAQRGAPGAISEDDIDPWYVAKQLQMEEEEVREGIRLCVQARLIEIEDGVVTIIGWTDEYAKYPLGAAEKQKSYRDRLKKKTPKPPQNGPTLPTKGNALPEQSNALPVVTQVGRKVGREGSSQLAPDPPAFDPNEVGARRKLANDTWSRLSAIRVALAAELGIAGVCPLTVITPASEPRGYRELMDRIREEGSDAPRVCARVLESITAEARSKRSVEWVGEKATSEGAWRTAKERVPKWADAVPTDKPRAFTQTIRRADGRLVRITEDAAGNVISAEPVEEASAEAHP
jgi:hypothetical protein